MALMTGKLPVKNSRYHSKMQKAMKKTIFLSVVAVTAAALVSCQKEQDNNVPEKPQGIPFEITAGTVETKTANDGMQTTWKAGDKINLFHAEEDTDSYVSDGSFTAAADGASVAFNGTLGEALDGEKNYDWYALYPYENDYANSPALFDYVYIADRNNSYTQTQVGNDSKAHLAGDGYPLWGKTNVAAATKPAITMNQMTSVIAVNVTNKIDDPITVSKVEFWSSAETHLVGEYRVNFSGTSPVLSNSAGEGIATLNVSGASALAKDASGVYYFAVKPFDAPAGASLSIRVTTDEGVQTSENIVPLNYSFTAGKIYTLNFNFTNKTVNLSQFPYNDPDWLTAQSINPGGSSDKDLNGATQTVGSITVSSTDGGTKTRVHKTTGTPDTYDLRVYKNGGSLTVAPTSSSYVIEKVTFAGSGLTAAKLSADSGTYTEETTTWTGLAQDVTFTASDTWNIKNIGVFYRTATASDHILIVPVKAFDAAYTAGSVGITIKQLNIADLVVSSSSAGYVDYSVVGNTITVNYSTNSNPSPRDIVVSVSSASAGVDETVTITQAGGPSAVSTLVYDTPGTVTAQIAAFSTKGFILADNTGAILVYTNANNSSTYSIGQTMTVGGTVGHYNRGLQLPTESTITPGAAGSFEYPTPTTFTETEIGVWNSDEADRFASYVTLTGVIKKNGSNYDIIVGAGSDANVTLYYPLSTFTSGLAEGDNVTITGYAMNVMSSKCGIVPTNVVNNETTPKIIYSNITGVAAAGVTNQKVSGSAFRVAGWTPDVTFTGCVSEASINAACTQITYSASENSLTTQRAGTIVVTFSKAGEEDVQYIINVTQDANTPSTTWNLATNSYASATDDLVTWSSTPMTMTLEKGSSSTKPNNYLGGGSNTHTRFYKNNVLTITPATGKTIVSIVFTCVSGYDDELSGSTWGNASSTYSSGTVTVTPTNGASAVTATIGTATRVTSVKVSYTE